MKLTRIATLRPLSANGNDSLGKVSDAILDLPERRLAYWQLDLGGRAGVAPVLVSAARTRLIDDTLRIDLPEDVLAAARGRALAGQEDVADLQAIPDIVTGPFGYTISPSMMGALLNSWMRRRRVEAMPLPKGAPDGWLRIGDFIGKPVFGDAGEIGTVSDAVVQGPDCVLTQLLLHSPEGGVDRALPIGVLRHVPRGASHFVAHVSPDGSVRARPPHQPAAVA